MGSNFLFMLPADAREILLSCYETLTPEEPVISYDDKVRLDDNRFIWQQVTIRRLFDESGNTTECRAWWPTSPATRKRRRKSAS